MPRSSQVQRRNELGLCVSCGQREVEPNFTQCHSCKLYAVDWFQENKAHVAELKRIRRLRERQQSGGYSHYKGVR